MKHALIALATLPLVLTACSGSTDGDESQTAEAAAEERVVSYTVRGQVASLPDNMNDLMVKHEAIPEFRSPNGTLGMNVMTMGFPLAEGVSSEGMSVGDKVATTVEVRHQRDWTLIGYETVSWEALPAETELNFTPIETGVRRYDPDTGEPVEEPADTDQADEPGDADG